MNLKVLVTISVLSTFLLFSNLLEAQENFIPGYVIAKNNDTIKGYVDYRGWERNPDRINFKKRLDSNIQQFSPIDISGFFVNHELYKSGIVEVEISPIKITPTELDKIKFNTQTNIVLDTTFLFTVFDGEKSLYYYKNKEGRDNFYIEKNSNYELLIYKKYLKDQDGSTVIAENNKYIGQLIIYINNCESIIQKINATSYTMKSLVKLFEAYYHCTNSNLYFSKKEVKLQTEFSIIAGLTLTNLVFKSDYFDVLVKTNYDLSMNVCGGMSLDLIVPRNMGKWSVNNELFYSSYKAQGTTEEYFDETYSKKTTTEFAYSYLKLNNMIRYKHPFENWQLYFNAGIANGLALSETNYKKEVIWRIGTEKINEGKGLKRTRKYEQSFLVGAGVKFEKWSFETRYEKGGGMSVYPALTSSPKRWHFIVGYKF